MLAQAGFEYNAVLHSWRDKGWLKVSGTGLTYPRQVGKAGQQKMPTLNGATIPWGYEGDGTQPT